jgi:hypothetical protein
MDLSGGAGVNDEISYIGWYMRKEAKYKLKRPVVRVETRSCLTKDDMDLRVTVCHIRWSPFRSAAHILAVWAISIVDVYSAIEKGKLEVD